jgi:hypothetical protein
MYLRRGGPAGTADSPGGDQMTITIRKPGEPTYFDSVACYQPIKGGTRHLTDLAEKPRNGTVIRFLCEMTYVVGTQRRFAAHLRLLLLPRGTPGRARRADR